MQLSAARHSCRAYGRYTQSRTVAVRPMHEGRILLNYRRVAVRATEDAPVEPPLEEPVLPPLDRARKALDDGSLDKEVLSSCLDDLEDEMERLLASASSTEERAKALEGTASTAKDQYVRLQADFDNFRRRTREENAQLTDSVRGDVIKELLPIVDNFELARTQVKTETESELKINNSYQSLYKQMVDMMRALGVEVVPTTGNPFDPAIHDAIMREPSTSHPDGTVLHEFRKGFSIGGKLLRPAMVKVSYTEEGPANSSEE